MTYQPGNTRIQNQIEMRQQQPMPQPAMRYSAPNVHQHSTSVHVTPGPQHQPTPPPNVYNNSSYYSYCECLICVYANVTKWITLQLAYQENG